MALPEVVGEIDNREMLVLFFDSSHLVEGAVGRPVVDRDHFELVVRLVRAKDAVDGAPDGAFFVLARDHDRNRWAISGIDDRRLVE